MPRKQKRAFKPMSAPAASASEQESLAAEVEQLASGEPAGEILEKPEYDYLADRDAAEIRRLAREVLRRQCEALTLYEPLPLQEEFHKSRARRRVLRGGNRSGKTLSSAIEVARAVCGKDPYHKYPTEDGRCYVVGLDLMHVSQVFYKNLFRPGAFKMIRDEETNRWRAYRPWVAADAAREKEAKWAPPLIPNRYIESIAWELKSKGIPRLVKLTNGWELAFFSSQAKPPQGMQIDLCLAGWSEVYDPVAGRKRRIDEIDGPFHVESRDPRTGEIVALPASRPFVKGCGEVVRVELTNGETIYTTRHHRVESADGRWVSVQRAFEEQIELWGDASRAATGTRGESSHGEQLPEPLRTFWRSECSPSARGEFAELRPGLLADGPPTIARSCESACGRPGWRKVPGCRCGCSACRRPCGGRLPSASNTDLGASPSRAGVRGRGRSSREGGRAPTPCGSRPRRRRLPFSALAAGLSTAPALARCRPSTGPQSRAWDRGGAASRSRSATCLCPRTSAAPILGRSAGTSACGTVGSGCRTRQTTLSGSGNWSGSASSASRCRGTPQGTGGEARLPADTWLEGARQVLSWVCGFVVKIKYIASVGLSPIWDISVPHTHSYLYGGLSNHNCWMDEELEDEEWYPEMAARLMDRRGLLIWSAAPQAGNEQLMVLSERADREKSLPPFERTVEEYVILTADNPHIPEQEKRVLAADLTDEQYDVRVSGEFAAMRWKVFPEFQQSIHVRDVKDVPLHWTRYAAIDPGRQVCAVLFGAVPDPAEGQPFDMVLYDELYIRDCSAAIFGERMAEKCGGQQMELFVIDWQMGRQTQIGIGETVEFSYSKALKVNRVRSRRSGHGFAWGDSNVQGGLEQVRGWLRINPNTGCPRLIVMEGKCPNFREEIKRYRYKRVKRIVTDEPETRGAVHSMAALRYLIGCHPRFVKASLKEAETGAYRAFKEKEKRRRKQMGEDVVRLGPGR